MAKSTRNKAPTMYDVARLAGVSQPTVSRVLNQNETTVQISAETRQRVLAAIEQLGYRPNILARGLRTQRTQTIALLIADLANGFYHVLARAIQDVARQHDYEVLIANSDHLYANEKHFCEVVARRVDGVILVPIHLTTSDIEQFFAETNTPISVLGLHIDHPQIDAVWVNDERASYEGVRWLINERGYDSVGFVGVSDDLPPGPRRLRGYRRALDEYGVPFDERFHFTGDFTMESGFAAARAFVAAGARLPRALYVLNDLMAIGVILGLQEAGYHVPNDVAVLGFDDIVEAKIVRPALTTIAQDSRDVGRKLAEMLFERIHNPDMATRRSLEGTYKLVVRDSA